MSKPLLLIRLLENELCEWQSEDGLSGQGQLESVAMLTSGRSVVMALPALWFSYFELTLPITSFNKAIKSAPFAIEDQLSEDPDSYFYCAEFFQKGHLKLWVVAKKQIYQLAEWLDKYAINIDRCVPESSLLPTQAESLTLLATPIGILAKRQDAPQVILPYQILKTYLQDPAIQPYLANIILINENNIPIELSIPHKILQMPTKQALLLGAKNSTIALDFPIIKRHNEQKTSSFWKIGSIALGIVVLLLLAMPLIQYQILTKQIATLKTEMETILKTADPKITRIVNPKAQLAALAENPSNRAQTENIDVLLNALLQIQTSYNNLQITALRYQEGKLNYQLNGSNLDASTLAEIQNKYSKQAIKANPHIDTKDGQTSATIELSLSSASQ